LESRRPNVEEFFLQAVQMDPAERLAFLEARCADNNLRARIEALLKAHDSAGDFLEKPAVQPAQSATEQNPLGQFDVPTSPRLGEPAAANETLDFLTPCETPERLGLLAHYEILDILGRGGMGVVVRGLDVKLNRVVAIKVLAPQLAANAMARRLFLREAQAAAAVSHQHVVAIHAVDEFKGLPYLVMEYVSGSSLQEKIDGAGALQLTQVLRISTQIASGLAAAHAQGLVHRDIKPANILLENGIERVKITDFGLARSVDDGRITQPGVVYGTPLYMSPEQAQGERVDQRSDLFSLGSVMYAMTAGRPPFRGDTGLAVLKRVCDDAPRPIEEIVPDVPVWLSAIIGKLHEKNPANRFASAQEVADLLGRRLSELQQTGRVELLGESLSAIPKPTSTGQELVQSELPRTETSPQRRRRWVAPAAAIVLLLAGFGLTEATGVTNVCGIVMRRFSRDGDVVLRSDQPARTGSEEKATHEAAKTAVPKTSRKYGPGTVDRPVKVFILAGDSNMAGRAKTRLLKTNPARTKEYFQHLLNENRTLVVREDVWVKNLTRKGNLTPGYGFSSEDFGPELEFGHVVGDHFDEQVLLIKTCFGGPHQLSAEFRPPSCGTAPLPIVEDMLKDLKSQNPNATLADAEARSGVMYRDMLAEVRQTLANLGEHFPAYRNQGYEIAGFVWFSGWTDMVHVHYTHGYSSYLASLIRDVRTDLKTTDLPFVVGQMGVHGGSTPGTRELNFRSQQASVGDFPEFVGNVKVVATDPFWDHEAEAVYKKGWRDHVDDWELVGSDHPYHYLGSAKTIVFIGRAFGEAIIELNGSSTKK
jgi:serine/threonine protein kinase